jgi:hypothetical protein
LNCLVDFVGELQLRVRVASVRVVGVGADREVLLALVLQDPLAPWRAVALLLYLLYQRPYLAFVGVVILRQQLHKLVVGNEVPTDHR